MRAPLLALAFTSAAVALAADPPKGIVKIEPLGEFIHEPNLPGERRADDTVPGQCSCLRVSRDRWLVLLNTRGFRGVDDERSVLYQLRKDAPDGPVIKEGFLDRAVEDFDPLRTGKPHVKQHGHVVGYGVPKGALVAGKPVANANLFAVHWRTVAIPFDPVKKQIARTTIESRQETAGVEWVQLRLNADESDIEVVQPVCRLRQVGFETGPKFCELPVASMNQSFVMPVPANAACTEWFTCNHFDGDRIAVLKVAFDPQSKLYRWVKCGPLAGGTEAPVFEGNISHVGDEWIVSARSRSKGKGCAAWCRTPDPMASLPNPTVGPVPTSDSPIETYVCADGQLRIFTGDAASSPQRRARDPLFVWDVDPKDFSCTNRQTVFDTVAAKLPFRSAAQPKVDFAGLFPPHGNTQIVTYRVNVRSNNFGYPARTDIPPITPEEKAKCGVYYTRLTYASVRPEPWVFQEK